LLYDKVVAFRFAAATASSSVNCAFFLAFLGFRNGITTLGKGLAKAKLRFDQLDGPSHV
jgi:hypothetical protein